MKFFRRSRKCNQGQIKDKLESAEEQLGEHTEKLAEHARRLRRLEIEVGIYKPPLKAVKGVKR